MKKTILAVVFLAIFVTAVAYKQTGFSVLGASPPPETPGAWIANTQAVGIGIMYFVLTLLGILAGAVFEALGAAPPDKEITLKDIRGFLMSARAWRGLVASPLIFLVVYMGVASNPVTLPFVVLSFQNGFFWKSAMSRIMGEHAQT
jgi:hypothetical protein